MAEAWKRDAALRTDALIRATEAGRTRAEREAREREHRIWYSRYLANKYFPSGGRVGNYYHHEMVTGQSGVYSLVIRANFPRCFDLQRDRLSMQEVILDVKTAHCHSKLSLPMSKMVANLIDESYKLGKAHQLEDTSSEAAGHRRLKPATGLNEVLTRYRTSKKSILQNLPTPTVEKLGDHAHTNILECCSILLANGNNIADIPKSMTRTDIGAKFSNLWESPRALEIAQWARQQDIPGEAKIIPYIIWRDDVEPNWVKSNKGSVWLCTLSFLSLDSSFGSRYCTFPLAVGKSRDSHRGVERLIHDVMRKQAAKPHVFYSATKKSEEKEVCVPILISTDSPEKRKSTMTAMGNATFHARFRCSADHNALQPVIRTCPSCLALMRGGELPRECNSCVNWDVLRPPEAFPQDGLKLDARENYPMSHLTNSAGIKYLTADDKIVPFEITYSRLKMSLQLAFSNYAEKKWNEAEVRAFLSVECFNGKLTDEIIENGTNARIISEIHQGTSPHSEEDQALFLVQQENEPEMYCAPPEPAVWNAGEDISIYVDAPMHLLFLGIIKSSLFSLKKWLEKKSYLTDFLERSEAFNRKLDQVKLDWLRIEDFREGKFGAWVSENFVAFSRILLWFFQDVGALIREELEGPDSEPPSDTPNYRWRRKHCRRWLHDRDLKFEGKVDEMKAHIQGLIERGEAPPIIDRTGEANTEQIERVLLALESMITVLMTDEVIVGVTGPLAELKIKHFLAEFDLLNQAYLEDGQKPKVIAASNYLTLLNLPRILERFGPLRKLWEGDFCGEKYVQVIKPSLHNGQRKNFAFNGMMNAMKDTTLDMATAPFYSNGPRTKTTSMEWSEWLQSSWESFKTYKTRKDILGCVQRKGVLSTVVFLGPLEKEDGSSRDSFIYASARCLKSEDDDIAKFQLYRLRTDLGRFSTKLKMKYYKWSLDATPTSFGDLLAAHPPSSFSGTFGCLLPITDPTNVHGHMHVCRDRSIRL